MKHVRMTEGKGQPPNSPPHGPRPADTAFDKWLNRGLHELFDDVMKEPVPPQILDLLTKGESSPKGTEDKKKDRGSNREGSAKK